MLLPRHSTKLSIPLLALPLSCTGEGQNDEVADGSTETGDGDGDGDGDGGACTAPGTTVPGIDPFVPADNVPDPTCSTGWASDAPLQDAKWVAMIPDSNAYYYSSNPIAKGLSGGAALLLSETTLQWFDGQGTPGASLEHGLLELRPEAVYVREADDHVFIAGPVANDVVILEFVDGAMVSELMVPTPGENTRVAGLYPFSTDEWLIVGDEFDAMEGNNEVFFMRVDGLGNQVLRKATSPGYSYYYYSTSVNYVGLDADDNLLFGSNSQQWLVDPNDGTVINSNVGLNGVRAFVASRLGSGFVWAGLQNMTSLDATVNAINGFGVSQWTRSYDRALTGEFFFDLAARPGGGYVAAGLDGIWWQPEQFQSGSQPLVVAFSEQGDAEWIGRLAIPGDARSVDVAADGGVVAAGRARTGGTSYDDVDGFLWVASW